MKVEYPKAKVLYNPRQEFEGLKRRVTHAMQHKHPIKPLSFSCDLHDIGNSFLANNQQETMNKLSKGFAEYLVSCGQDSLAGIVYSFLIKFNAGNPKVVEELATKALAIAKRQHDPIHIMARANDLKTIYAGKQADLQKYIKLLYEERRALSDICKNYDKVEKRFNTLKTKMKPIENYKRMLASIQVEIAKQILKSDPKQARYELNIAQEILNKYPVIGLNEKVQELLSQIKN